MNERGFAIGEGSASAWVSRDEVHELLEQAEVTAVESIPWSSNYTFATRLLAENYPPFLAVYKPRRGEIPLYDFPDGTLYKRERAAYVTSVAFGWDFIPPTVIRDGPHGIGSFQLLVDVEPRADFFHYKDNHVSEVQVIGLFDVIANNADRKAGHVLKDKQGKLWGIDHGLTFNVVPSCGRSSGTGRASRSPARCATSWTPSSATQSELPSCGSRCPNCWRPTRSTLSSSASNQRSVAGAFHRCTRAARYRGRTTDPLRVTPSGRGASISAQASRLRCIM